MESAELAKGKPKDKKVKPKDKLKKAAVGLAIGVANGLFGAGGGSIAVVALNRVLKVEDKKAHATSILIILPLTIASFLVYLKDGAIDFQITWKVVAGGILGGLVGAFLLKRLSNRVVKILFSVMLIAAGIRMVFLR